MRNILLIILLLFPLYTSCLYAQVGDSLTVESSEYNESLRPDSLRIRIGGKILWADITPTAKRSYLADLQLCEGIISVALDSTCTDLCVQSLVDFGGAPIFPHLWQHSKTDVEFSSIWTTGIANILPPKFVKKGLSRPYIPLWRIPHLRRLSLSPMYNLTAFVDSINTLPSLEWLGLYSSAAMDTKAGLTGINKINWVQKFPNLHTLHISWNYQTNHYKHRKQILSNILQLPKLEELVCYTRGDFDTTLAHTLPNLKRLSIGSDSFPAFLAQCPNIEELIFACNVLDTAQQIAHYAQLFQRWLLQSKHLRVLQLMYAPIANFQGTTAPASPTEGHTLTHLLVGDNGALVQAILKGQQHLFPNLHTVYWSATQYKNVEELHGLVEFLSHFPNVDTLYLGIGKAEELEALLNRHPLFFQRLKVLYLSDLVLLSPDLDATRQRIAPNLQIKERRDLHLVGDYFKL